MIFLKCSSVEEAWVAWAVWEVWEVWEAAECVISLEEAWAEEEVAKIPLHLDLVDIVYFIILPMIFKSDKNAKGLFDGASVMCA